MKERWVLLRGFGRQYEVSDLGRVRAVGHIGGHRKAGKILTQKPDDAGYLRVRLVYKDGVRRRIGVARLVARAFLAAPRRSDAQANHVDGDKTDNRACRLQWLTPEQNTSHAHRNGLVPRSRT